MRELSWQNSCIRVPQSEWTSHRHNFNVFMYLVYFSFIFRNGTILAVSQRVAIEIGRRVVWFAANNTHGNPGIAHPYPQLTTPTRISLEKSFPETISGPAPESPWQLSLPWPVAAHTILLCIWPWYESRGNSAPFWIRTSVIRNDFYWNLDTSGACHIAIYFALVWVKRKQWPFLNSNKRHSKWLPSKPGAIDCSATAGCFSL